MSKDTKQQISDKINSLSGDDTRLAELLSYSIGRLCLISEKFGGSWKDDLAKINADHVVDWLKDALINDAAWLRNVDEQNRPNKLIEFSDFNIIIQEVNKTFILSLLDNKHIQMVKNGFFDINDLPERLKLSGSLNLEHTGITSLPEGLEVKGHLDLEGTHIKSLPDDLKVGGNLNIQNTRITSLPNNLKVGGNLNIQNVRITQLPSGLEVGGSLYPY